MNLEERLIDLESRLATQDHLLDVLNRTVFRQQQQLDELERLCATLAKRLAELKGSVAEGGLPHEKPPHY